MIMRSLQPEFARHLMGFPYTDFGSLVHALYGTEEGIARGLCPESSPTDFKRKKPLGRKRSRDISAISLVGLRPPRHYHTVGQTSRSTTHYHLMCSIGHGHLINHMIMPTYLLH